MVSALPLICYIDVYKRQEMHTIDKITGVSLEKKSPELSSLNKNWRSSKHATGGLSLIHICQDSSCVAWKTGNELSHDFDRLQTHIQ